MDRPRPVQLGQEATREPISVWADVPWWCVVVVFAPTYLIAILVGYAFYLTPDSISTLWPASGVALATLTLTRYRVWPAVVLVLMIIEMVVPWLLSDADILSFMSPSNVAEPVVGAFLLRWTLGPRVDVSRFRHAVGLVIMAAIIGPALVALPGAYQVTLAEPDIDFLSAWQVWWFGSALGVAVVAPVILSWADRHRRTLVPRDRVPELLVLLGAIVAVGVWVFGAEPRPFRSILDLPFVAFPLLIWITLRFDIRIVTSASLLIAFFSAGYAAQFRGPFMMVIAETVQANILAIQAFIATSVLSALFLSAALADRKRAAEERAVLRAQVAEGQKLELVARLAGSVAHDFNNDLTIMMSWADYLEGAARENPDVERAVSQISRAAKRAASITSQLLSFGRTAPGPKQTVSIIDVTPAWRNLLRPLFHGSRRLEVSADPDVGYVRADPHQLEQILLNLAINARDAMENGGTLRIRASRVASIADDHAQGASVCITVRDDGEGMSPDVLDRIFDPFFTTKTDGRGTGLGLPSVQRIVEGLGGRIEVDSNVGHGTTFRLYLPPVDPPAVRDAQPSHQARRASETVLVVDDDDDVRDAVVLALESGGYTVLRAADGSEALEVIGAHADIVDLVVTDLNMPKGGGEALIDALGTKHPNLPVVVVSGYSSSDGAEIPDEVLFVPKPFSSRVLLSYVREALEQTRH